jgi:putative DNA primase/helicase
MIGPDDDGLARVRDVLAVPQDVGVPDGMHAPHPADDEHASFGDPGPQDADGAARDFAPRDDAAPQGGGDDPELQARLEKASSFALNDVGNGQRMGLHFGGDILWVPRVGWHNWTGTHWQVDPDQIAIRRVAQQLGPLIAQEVPFIATFPGMWARLGERDGLIAARATALLDKDDAGKLTPAAESTVAAIDADLKDIADIRITLNKLRGTHLSFSKTSGNSGRMLAAIDEAGFNLVAPIETMDAAPMQINTLSGVLSFSVTLDAKGGKVARVDLLPHARDQRHTKIMPVSYDPEARAPGFHAFLNRIQPDIEIRRFLQRVFGLAMTGLTGDQMLCFFYGMGANGKSVLVDLISRILGDYAATAKIESLTGQNRRGGGDATPDLVPLIGARLVRASEPDEGVKWQEGLIKDLTGGEPILVRALNENFVTVRPQFKLVISGNHKPDIRGTDDGIWRRLKLIPFDVQIPIDERVPKDQMDAALFAEASGVLNWMIDGLLDYLEIGLNEPVAVTQATREFREESDPFGTFLHDCCVVDGEPRHSVGVSELMHAFLFWQAQNGQGAFKDATISKKLAERSRNWRSRSGHKFERRKSNGVHRYDGIRLTDIFARDWEDAPKDARGRSIISGRPVGGNDGGGSAGY